VTEPVWGSCCNSLVNPILIVGAVGGKGSEEIGKLVEKRTGSRGIVDLFP
jgi:hypothetical protein